VHLGIPLHRPHTGYAIRKSVKADCVPLWQAFLETIARLPSIHEAQVFSGCNPKPFSATQRRTPADPVPRFRALGSSSVQAITSGLARQARSISITGWRHAGVVGCRAEIAARRADIARFLRIWAKWPATNGRG
jgi:hypothetical protein